MKIAIATSLYATDEPCDSGIAIHYKHLTAGLLELGHEVVIYFFPYESFQSSRYESNGVTVHQLGCTIPKLFYRRGIGRLLKLFKITDWYPTLSMQRQVSTFLKKRVNEDRIDIIESTSNRGMLANYAKYRNRPPICTRVSTTMTCAYANARNDVPINYQIEAKLEKLQIKRSNSLVTHSHRHSEELEKELGIANKHFKIIPHGIPIPQKFQTPTKCKTKELKILFVGRLERRKGIDVLLKAIPLVLSKFESVVFSIIGSDPNVFSKSFLQNSNLEKKVLFRGKVSDGELKRAYQECDIFVAPSYYESFGLIYLEAMSFSKPTIGTTAGGIPDVIVDNHTGRLIEPGDHEALAEVIIQLVNSPEMRLKLGTNGRKRVEERFSTEAMTESTIEHFQTLL